MQTGAVCKKVMDTLKKMENFCLTKKNMFLPIRDGIIEALWELQLLKKSMKRNDCYIQHFEYHFKHKIVQKIKEVRSPKNVVLDEETEDGTTETGATEKDPL